MDAGDQHIGGQASGKVQGTVREIDYLKTCHDALTDVWLLGEETETGISYEQMFSKDANAVVAQYLYCSRFSGCVKFVIKKFFKIFRSTETRR